MARSFNGHRFMVIDINNSWSALHKLAQQAGVDHYNDTQELEDLFVGCEFVVGDKVTVTKIEEITLMS